MLRCAIAPKATAVPSQISQEVCLKCSATSANTPCQRTSGHGYSGLHGSRSSARILAFSACSAASRPLTNPATSCSAHAICSRGIPHLLPKHFELGVQFHGLHGTPSPVHALLVGIPFRVLGNS